MAVGRAGGRAVLFIVLLAAWPPARLAAQCPDGSPPPCAGARAPTPVVAVLLFENLTRDTNEAYIAPGLTEELTRLLSQTPGLRVASRSQTRRFGTGAGRDPSVIAAALRAGFLVTGTVQKTGSNIRVTAELTRLPGGARVWGSRFDRPAERLLVLQDEVAAAVAQGVLGRVLPEPARAARSRPVPPEAHERFLRGNYRLDARGTPNITRAIADYARAIELAPDFGRAFARHAYAHALILTNVPELPTRSRDSILALGLASVAQAKILAPGESDTWMAEAYLRISRFPGTFEGALEAFERAIGLDPDNAEAHHQFASVLAVLGRDSASEAEFRRALALDRERWSSLWELGRLLHLLRRLTEAVAQYDSAQSVQPIPDINPLRARALLTLGDTAKARAAIDAAQAGNLAAGLRRIPHLDALLAAARGDTAAARAILQPPIDGLRNGSIRANFSAEAGIAAALVATGMTENALEWLERMGTPDLRIQFLLRYPEFDPLRSHPRFQRVLAAARGAVP